MPTPKGTIYACSKCGAQFTKWTGRCLECGSWGTVSETAQAPALENTAAASLHQKVATKTLAEISAQNAARIPTNIKELDQVLGGGLVPGSIILLGGEPGIGKSTLAMQIALALPQTIYFSGEESVEQIKLRVDRLAHSSLPPELRLANSTNLESILATITQEKPRLAIIDSIQTVTSEAVDGEPGNANQIRACASMIMGTAKSTNVATVIIGHVTKDGSVAGPKTLEHLVDTVLYFEGDRFHNLRVLRGIKNRFGSTDEIGLFQMTGEGLQEVANPSQILLSEKGEDLPGSVITCLIEGRRPILVEVQALVNKTVFGYPVRKASGFDVNRLHVLAAVLQRRAGINLAQYDIHINVVGGLSAEEPAADLAVALAIGSAYKNKTFGKNIAAFGEIGLGGEIRSVNNQEQRLKECANLGIKNIIVPRLGTTQNFSGPNIIPAKHITDLIKGAE